MLPVRSEDTTGRALNRLEQLNIMMDNLAKLTATHCQDQHTPITIPQIGIQTVKHEGHILSGNLYRTLYHKITSKQAWEYISQKSFQPPQAFTLVNMTAFEKARKNSTTTMNIFISKWISDTLATGIVMQRRQHRIFNRCPRCNHWGEDRLHLVVCWDTRANMVWRHHMEKLSKLLNKEHTHPDISQFLVQGLEDFRTHPRRHNTQGPPWKEEIGHIGWFNVISGFIGCSIITQQDNHYKRLGLLRTGTGWASKLIQHLWNMIYHLWINRNEILHQKEVINSISGEALLDIEIEKEYDQGYQNLPAVVHKWFKLSKDQLLRQSTEKRLVTSY
jgi:hypothetical protein